MKAIPKPQYLLNSLRRSITITRGIAVVAAAALVIGGFVLLRSHASSFFAGVEPESGTLSANAKAGALPLAIASTTAQSPTRTFALARQPSILTPAAMMLTDKYA